MCVERGCEESLCVCVCVLSVVDEKSHEDIFLSVNN
jgi:hypothetical protein